MQTTLAKAAAGIFNTLGSGPATHDDVMMGLARRAAASLQKVTIAGASCFDQCRAVPAALASGTHMTMGNLVGARDHADRVIGAVLACDRPCPVAVCANRALQDLEQFARIERMMALRARQEASA